MLGELHILIYRTSDRIDKFSSRSDVTPTQDAALREIIELSFEGDQLRLLLKSNGQRAIGLLRQNHVAWHNLPKPIQSRAEKAFVALADENASIKGLVQSLLALPTQLFPQMKVRLRACLL